MGLSTRKIIYFFSAALFLLCLPLSSFAQQYNFRNYSVDEGLAQSQVYALCEDGKGNIWFGTRGGGLSRFDGISFTGFTVQEGLASNYIRTIIRDPAGNLWIGTDNGLCKYDGRRFTNYGSRQGLYNETINALTIDRRGNLWIGTEKGIFHLEKDSIVRFGRKAGAPMERITSLQEDRQGRMWAGSDFGVYRFELSGKEWKMDLFTVKDGLSSNLITSLALHKNGALWICTYSGGVSILQHDRFRKITQKDGITSNTVFSCAFDEDSVVWLGTANGVTRLQTMNDSLFVMSSVTQTEGLANNVVMSVLKDSFGNLWFGTSGGGVSKLDSERFMHYTTIKGVFGSLVYAIVQDKAGNMWFGTSEGGVTKYDGKYYKRYSERNGFTASKVKSIYEDSGGNLWFGTISDGLYLYNGKTFRHFNNKNGLSSNFINCILSDTSGRVYLGTAGGGISYLMPSKNHTYSVRYIKPGDGLGSDRINTLLMDDKGVLWAGGNNGVISKIIFTGEEQSSIDNYNSRDHKGSIRSSVKDNKGILYFGTADRGVLRYDRNQFYSWGSDQGLASNNIYSLVFDDQRNLWCGTEKGIDKITFAGPEIKAVRHYGKSEGFIGIETAQNAVCKDRSGNLWFGTLKSATVYNPTKEKPLKLPLIQLTGVNLFFERIENTPFSKNASSWYSIPRQLVLPYDQNHLSFEFAGIEQRNPGAVRYKWTLEGFDEKWSPVTSRREAVYSNLPPGEYIFKVVAANELNQWNDHPAVFTFVIRPPFWKTWWFRIIAVILFIVSAWGLIAYAYRKVREENRREKEKLETEKTLIELEQKALRLQMNPHFLFNCLNSIKGLIAENKQEDAKIYLSKFAKLMRSMLDHSMEAFISLESEIAGLYNYAELEKLSREGKFDFNVEVDPDIDPSSVKIPPMMVQPFVENAILHGIAPKTGKGKVHVSFVPEGNYLHCIVEDDGIGREKAGRMRNASSHEHKSAAITVTQERLNILNKKLNFGEVKILIHDLKNEQNAGAGTRVELFIPYQTL